MKDNAINVHLKSFILCTYYIDGRLASVKVATIPYILSNYNAYISYITDFNLKFTCIIPMKLPIAYYHTTPNKRSKRYIIIIETEHLSKSTPLTDCKIIRYKKKNPFANSRDKISKLELDISENPWMVMFG